MTAISMPGTAALERAERAYRDAFDTTPEVVVRAPGRVNLIGEHTDYNDGFVLPMAIPPAVYVAAGRRPDARVHVHAADYHEDDSFASGAVARAPGSAASWPNYVRGVAWAWQATRRPVPGCNLAIAADLTQRAGLSSSAALELGIAVAFQTLLGIALPRRDAARLCQTAENDFVGLRCGIMDQVVVALAEPGCALLVDTRSLDTRPVPLPDQVAVLIVDSGADRELAASGYNQRRAECEVALAGTRAAGLEATALRDLAPKMLPELETRLAPTLLRRVRHVVEENVRVLAMVDALERADLPEAGRLMLASHESQRDLFEVSTPKLDRIVELTANQPGVFGARLTGGGFGGSAVALVDAGRLHEVCGSLTTQLSSAFGEPAQLMAVVPTGAVDPLPITPPVPSSITRPDGRALRLYSFPSHK